MLRYKSVLICVVCSNIPYPSSKGGTSMAGSGAGELSLALNKLEEETGSSDGGSYTKTK